MKRTLPCDVSGSLVLSRRLPLILALFFIAVWVVSRKSLPDSFTVVVAGALLLLIISWVTWPKVSRLQDLAVGTIDLQSSETLARTRVVSALLRLPVFILFLLLLLVTLELGNWRAGWLLFGLSSLFIAFCATAKTGRPHARLLRDAQIPLLLLNHKVAISVLAMSYAVIILLLYFTLFVLL